MAALANDLNTAEARAPIFDLVRAANTAIDQGQLLAGDRDAILAVLASFDAVFDVIEDRDAEPTRRALEWAEKAGRMADVAPELLARQSLTDEAIEALVAERTRPKSSATLPAPTRSATSWRKRAWSSKTRRTACAGSGSKRSSPTSRRSPYGSQ